MRDDDLAQHAKAVSAKVVTRLDHRVVKAFKRRDKRHDHEQHRGIDKPDHHRRIIVKHLHRPRGEAKILQQGRDQPGFAQQDHPAECAHQFGHPERHETEQKQRRLHPALGDLGDVERHRKGDQKGDHRGQHRHHRRTHECAQVKRFAKEGQVIGRAGGILANADPLAQRQQQHIDMWDDDQQGQPQQKRRQQQDKAKAGSGLHYATPLRAKQLLWSPDQPICTASPRPTSENSPDCGNVTSISGPPCADCTRIRLAAPLNKRLVT